ncbi:hypothetical protein ZWY2020_029591 [Hordeum vulgare]|nr:hypothetical protein ZWY2020_029591 [Hordeum vulgare]
MGSQDWRRPHGRPQRLHQGWPHQLNGEYKDLDIAIVKATNHVECPPKERHFRSERFPLHHHTMQHLCGLVEATTLRLDQAAVLDGRQKRGYFEVVVLVAELGRLTLADALVYACNQGVDKIIDLATLTGACVVALGPSIAGIFTPSDELAEEVTAVSELSGEKFWRLPMDESY